MLTMLLPRPDYRKDPRFVSEYQWYASQWKPQPGVDYSKVLLYAREQYKETLSVFDSLDKKAEWCFGLGVTISAALIAFGANAGIDLRIVFPSIALLALSMWGCLRCRLPGPRATPFGVRSLIDVTENTKAAEARLAASINCAIHGIRIVTNWKSILLGHSGILVAVAILWIGIVYSFLSA
ncbi:MAG: hypothetical protein HQ582_28170 [Planctomycetes bacterium]|nr:hypothetical protein [Planctomycetota bacterium]